MDLHGDKLIEPVGTVPMPVLPIETSECPPFARVPTRRRRLIALTALTALAAAGVGGAVLLALQHRGPATASAASAVSDGYVPTSPPVSPRDRSAVLQNLSVLASAIDLYSTEHDGARPDLSGGWGPLIDYTSLRGRLSPTKAGDCIYGPYLRQPLVNPLNGSSKVLVVDALPVPGAPVPGTVAGVGWLVERRTGGVAATDAFGRRAFDASSVRSVDVDAVGGWTMPPSPWAPASDDARRSNVQTTVQTLRSQIALYKLQHQDALPDLVTSWDPLVKKTDVAGSTSPAAGVQTFGPYMQETPVNSLNGSSRIADGDGTAPAGTAVGFVYDYAGGAGSGKIWGTNVYGRTLIP